MNKFKLFVLPAAIILLVGGMIGAGVLLSKESSDETGTVLGSSIQIDENRKGNATAAIELVEYSDLQCPACRSFNPILNQLISEYGDRVNFAYRHLPLKEIHKNAVPAAYAAEAAGKQGKFWEMVDVIFTNQGAWSTAVDPSGYFNKYAQELGLNEDQFIRDMDSAEVKAKVDSDYKTAQSLGLNSTPTFFLNGEKISAPASYEQLVRLLGLSNE